MSKQVTGGLKFNDIPYSQVQDNCTRPGSGKESIFSDGEMKVGASAAPSETFA